MASRKKTKPSFDVPEELRSAPQAGWVYRTEAGAAEPAPKEPAARKKAAGAPPPASAAAAAAPPPAPEAAAALPLPPAPAPAAGAKSSKKEPEEWGIVDLAAHTFSSGFAAFGNSWLLAARILASPFSLGMKILGRK